MSHKIQLLGVGLFKRMGYIYTLHTETSEIHLETPPLWVT